MEEKEKNDLKEKGEWSDQGENLDEMRSTPEHHIHNLEKEMLRENIKKVRNDDDLTD